MNRLLWLIPSVELLSVRAYVINSSDGFLVF